MDKRDKYNSIEPTIKGSLEAHVQRIYRERLGEAHAYKALLGRILEPSVVKAIVIMFEEGMEKLLEEEMFQSTRRRLKDVLIEVSVCAEPLEDVKAESFSQGYLPFVDKSISSFTTKQSPFTYYHIIFCMSRSGLTIHLTGLSSDSTLPVVFATDLMNDQELYKLGL